MRGLLDIHILDASFLLVVYGLSTAAVAYLVIRRSTRSKPLILIAAALIGAGVGLLAGWIASGMWDFFGISFTLVTRMWISLAFAAIAVAVTNFRDSRWPRKAIASLSIGLFVLTAAVGINVDFGMFGTIKAALGAQSFPYLATTALHTPSTPIAQPLWKTWSAPAGMPARGTIGTVTIPATVSGFHARHALVYLPPAARVPNPPRLPVLMMLSGQPGAPYNIFDSARLADVLDSYSKTHAGLAPIVVVPDQLGSAYRNPMCVDSALGNSATYL
ncbi:MAG: alpha/beta hydrolase, partial [Microbacteriaceae bacterium]